MGFVRNRTGPPENAAGVGSNYLAVCDASDDDDAAATARGIRAVATGDRDEFSLEYPCHTPERDRWFVMQATPYEHDGERFVLVMHVDITDRRLLEQRTREQAAQMERFAKLLSHDLRNPLSVALARAETLESNDDVDLDRSSEDRSSLRPSLERMESIIEDALVLVTADAVEETELIPLSTAVETAWGHVHTKSATVSVADEVAIRADSRLLSHLFENLFRNAVEHAGDDVRIEVGALERQSASDVKSARSGDPGSIGRLLTAGGERRPNSTGSTSRTTGRGFP
nr:HAMP domain-containing sensor histidine kinase [Natrinema caseinilyticum]